MKTTTKKLRNCSATVIETVNDWGEKSYILRSYNTDVVMIGRLEGEVVNEATGEVFEADGPWYVILRAGWFDYSSTTMQHVRKFLADIVDWNVTISQLREMMIEPDRWHVVLMDW